MIPKITTILEEIGFPEREAKVYMALLELGSSTVLPVSQKAGIKRTYCYDVLESLAGKGAVTFFEKNGRRRYVAEDPAAIERILKERLGRFTEALPDIRLVYNNSLDKPVVRFFQGKEGLASLYAELPLSGEYCAIGSSEHLSRALGGSLEECARQIVKNKVRARELLTPSESPIPFSAIYKEPTQEIRLLPQGLVLETDMLIYQGKLVLISYGSDVHAVVIEGTALVETQQKLFELLWEAAGNNMA